MFAPAEEPSSGYVLQFVNGREIVCGDFDDLTEATPKEKDAFRLIAIFRSFTDAHKRKLNLEEQYQKAKLPIPKIRLVPLSESLRIQRGKTP